MGHITTKSVLLWSYLCTRQQLLDQQEIFRNIAKYISTAVLWGAEHIAYIQVIMVCSFLDIIYHFDG